MLLGNGTVKIVGDGISLNKSAKRKPKFKPVGKERDINDKTIIEGYEISYQFEFAFSKAEETQEEILRALINQRNVLVTPFNYEVSKSETLKSYPATIYITDDIQDKVFDTLKVTCEFDGVHENIPVKNLPIEDETIKENDLTNQNS